jgi:hypothetical protein
MRVERLDDDVGIDVDDDLDEGRDAPARPDLDSERSSPDTTRAGDGSPEERAARFAEYREKVDDVYRAHAIDQGCERVREIEEKIVTPAMQRIEAEDSSRRLVGLDHCLKGKDRIEEKVSRVINERGHSAQEAFGMVKDAIRYTFEYEDGRYADGVRADCQRLMDAGFEPVELKNSWDEKHYKGVNSRWRTADEGQLFEVQFHTAASFEAKQATHPAYEKLRVGVPTKAEQRKLEQLQEDVTARVPIPRGALDMPNYP